MDELNAVIHQVYELLIRPLWALTAERHDLAVQTAKRTSCAHSPVVRNC
jgi:hypothetical protein